MVKKKKKKLKCKERKPIKREEGEGAKRERSTLVTVTDSMERRILLCELRGRLDLLYQVY